jgi:hypothetical protein
MLEANLNARDTKIKTRAGEQCKVLSLANNVKINKTEPPARARKRGRKEGKWSEGVHGVENKIKPLIPRVRRTRKQGRAARSANCHILRSAK